MKKYIWFLNGLSVLEKLEVEKRVEGVLFVDKSTGRITFKAYNRKPIKRMRDRLIRVLENGWVKESTERIKVYDSIPKVLGTARVMSVLDREMDTAKGALIDRELIEFI